ncbi:MAG TPA: DUF748 domain-containing protein, partial [Magnetospirillaceae bacterium]|nr:DUF748 domain-containing protein [Magnetospirillaceae bacterium]
MQSEPPNSSSPARRWLDYRRKRFWGAAFILLYLLAGFFLLPAILRPRLIAAAQASLDRPVTLDGVGVNPLVLSVDLRGLRITEKDGAPLLGFDRLHVRLSLDSLFHWAWSFGTITLEGFKGDIVRSGAGDINITRLVPASSRSKDQPQPSPRLLIHHLSIKNAAASFTDHVPATPFTTQIGPVNAEIDHLGTLPDETGQLHVVMGLEKGATLELASQSSLHPLSSAGHIVAKGPYIPLIARYFGGAYKFTAPKGDLDAQLDYRLDMRADGSLGVAVEHLILALDNVAVQEKDQDAPFLALPQLRLTGGHLAWPELEASADTLSVKGMSLAVRRQEDGAIAPALPQKADWPLTVDLNAESLSSKPGAAFPFSLAVAMAPSGAV